MADGFIRQRGSSYEVVVYAGRDPVTGRKRQVSRSAKTKREAQQLRARLLVEYGSGDGGTEATFGKLVERWLEVAELSPSSRAAYSVYLGKHILPALGATRLDRLGAEDLDRFYRALGRKGLSPASIRKAHNVVSRALTQAVKWRWIPDNPARRASPPKVPKPRVSPPDPAQVALLLRAADEHDADLGTFLRLAAVTGARRGELCALRWRDVANGTVNIERGLVHGPEGVVERPTTKTGRARVVALDAGTIDTVAAHRARCRDRAEECGLEFDPHGFVFSTQVDGSVAWRPDGATGRFMRLRNRVGVPARLHDLRHFAATRMITAGVPVRTVSGRLGHSRASTTTDIYSHWVSESDQAAADVMGGLIDSQ